MPPDLIFAEAASMAGDPGSSQASIHGNVAKDQARAHYGNVYGDVYYGDGVQPKRDIAQEILASLRFPGMDRYHERPLESFPGTYKWIFNGRSTNFKQWLTSSDEVYWVNGKAGSGKSCLMKLISEHPRTTELLQEWAGGEVTIVPFFFWAAGGELEKSLLGLMRSLLFQILDEYREHVQTCLPQRWTAHARRANYGKPWSPSELHKALSVVLQKERMTSSFFFLIDGLDEFNGDHQDLIDYLVTLNTSDCVKLLVSSRPWNVFQAAYGRSDQGWRLRLQDLTSHDMYLFIKTRLNSDSRFQALMLRERSNGYDIVHMLQRRAEGVFLWVSLAIKTLRRGLSEHDTLDGLFKRLKLLPQEIEGMLQHIFDSIEPVYQQLAARTFLILEGIPSYWEGLPLVWIAYLEHELESQLCKMPAFDAHELGMSEEGWQTSARIARKCCRDLVEVHDRVEIRDRVKICNPSDRQYSSSELSESDSAEADELDESNEADEAYNSDISNSVDEFDGTDEFEKADKFDGAAYADEADEFDEADESHKSDVSYDSTAGSHFSDESSANSVASDDFIGRWYIQYWHRTIADFIRSKVQDGCLQRMAGPDFDTWVSICRLLVQVSAPTFPNLFEEIVSAFFSNSIKVCNFERNEDDLVYLANRLIHEMPSPRIQLTYESGASRNAEFPSRGQMRAAIFVGCNALEHGHERLFWSLVDAEPHYVTSKSKRAWMRRALSADLGHGLPRIGTIMKLCAPASGPGQLVQSFTFDHSNVASNNAMHDLCQGLGQCCTRSELCQLSRGAIAHITILIAACGRSLESLELGEIECKYILSWCDDRVNLDELASTFTSPSYTVNFHWGGVNSIELVWDEDELIREFWPSVKKVMEFCHEVVEDAESARSREHSGSHSR